VAWEERSDLFLQLETLRTASADRSAKSGPCFRTVGYVPTRVAYPISAGGKLLE
jgi:hypothetical protein